MYFQQQLTKPTWCEFQLNANGGLSLQLAGARVTVGHSHLIVGKLTGFAIYISHIQ